MRTSGDSAARGVAPVVAALDMGYGHLRAAMAIATAAGGGIVEADRPPVATAREEVAWRRARALYEGLSRAADAWYAPGARRLLDFVTGIPAPGARGAFEAPNLAAHQLDRLVKDGLGAGLAAQLRSSGAPLVSTFYATAIAAEGHGAQRVHLVVTDSDLNRVWVAADAGRSAITYMAPTLGAAARLASYGVAPERVRLTGFPLPPELTDGPAPLAALAARLARLDPAGTFRAACRAEIRARLGADTPPAGGPVTIVFAVGGAGAQTGVARTLLAALREPMARGAVRLVLVAGTRPAVAERLADWVRAARAEATATVLFERSFDAYYRRFNEALASADVLWTKPSELTFYGAIGLPLLLARPLGVHERRNRDWAVGLGAAIDGQDTRAAVARLPSLLSSGELAAAAWAGFTRMPREGTRSILTGLAG